MASGICYIKTEYVAFPNNFVYKDFISRFIVPAEEAKKPEPEPEEKTKRPSEEENRSDKSQKLEHGNKSKKTRGQNKVV